MNWTYSEIVDACSEKHAKPFLCKSKHGLERECLRIDEEGNISQTPHPSGLGSKLTNPYITTDFSEAQPELITPPFTHAKRTLAVLNEIHRFVNANLSNEYLWPFSTPCKLPAHDKIPLANYGTSDSGLEKYLYRCGLSFRYGRKMQTLSGVHYNFSLSDQHWDYLYSIFGRGVDRDHFISSGYLHLCRNFLRMGWLNTYLFGSTPCVDKTYFDTLPSDIQEQDSDTLYFKYATSLRMSRYGYYSREQDTINVSYNDIESYIHDFSLALSTPSTKFSQADTPEEKKAIQLNGNLLQIPAEHYIRIRPKLLHPLTCVSGDSRSHNRVKYVEVRDLDVNPFAVEGVELSQLNFLHTFMLYCLFRESPYIEPTEKEIIRINQDHVSLRGRDPSLKLKDLNGRDVPLKEWGISLLNELKPIAELLDNAHPHSKSDFSKSIDIQMDKFVDSEKTPSAQVLQLLTKNKWSYSDLGLSLAKEHQASMNKRPLSNHTFKRFEEVSQKSFLEQKEKELLDDFILKGYEDMELSTQMIIREARKRKVNIEIIDRNDNFIYLHKSGHSAYIKQATCTDKDSYMTYLMMENKVVTKHVLHKAGIRVPFGYVYTSPVDAIGAFPHLGHLKTVVKPVFTNFGIGVCIVPPADQDVFQKAVNQAFTFGDEVIVEEFCEGEEFRFLVIGDNVPAVCQRLPANVVGDGIRTIKELVKIKNFDPLCYKVPKYRIKLGRHEQDFLKHQNFTIDSVPKKGQRVFLRANSNVSTGGDPVDVTDQVHASYKAMALKGAKSVNARICGVDMIIRDKDKPQNAENYSIIELNFNPALLLHRYPVSGKIHYVERDLLDELGFNI